MTQQSRPDHAIEPREIAIETARVLERQQSHYGVIDVGSNSIRLVVYDDLSRTPFPRFNEKSMVALGAGLDAKGRFTKAVIARAVHAIRRMHAIARAMDVERIDVLATEATRRAKNGAALVATIRQETGLQPIVLSGEDEALHTAFGVISGFFQPHGMVGDIGGGSLEVAEVVSDSVGERVTSMPLGALPVKAKFDQGYSATKKWVDEVLADNLSPSPTCSDFFAVGGGWRALARVHIAMNDVPIRVVHGYEVSGDDFRVFTRDIARMSASQIAALPDVPSRRVDTLAASALVMSRVLKKLSPERVSFSACGLREGWLYRQLETAEQYRDPLLEGAQSIGLPGARVPAFSAALANWTDDLFPAEGLREKRLRYAASALTDIGWRDHDKVRASDSFQRLLQFPFIGVSHPERVFLALTIFARYGGKFDDPVVSAASSLLAHSDRRRAEILGRTFQLAHRFSASVPEYLEQARLSISADAVRLHVLDAAASPDSDAVMNRLRKVAKATDIDKAEIVVSDH